MRLILLVISLFLITPLAFGELPKCPNNKNPIYCKILKFKKNVDAAWAYEFSNKLTEKAKAYNIDPNIALAILLQESMLENVNTFKKGVGVKKIEGWCDEKDCYKITVIKEPAFDLSIAQINVNTADAYGFDKKRLFFLDQDYALECFFIILEDKMRSCKHLGKDSFSCYHSFTEKYRKTYAELVRRFL